MPYSKTKPFKRTQHSLEPTTSWQGVKRWYSDITKDKGHYYHEHIILPNVKKLLNVQPFDSLLDLACGTGVLGRSLPKSVSYVGVDIAHGLIEAAKNQDSKSTHSYIVGDITKPLSAYKGLKEIQKQANKEEAQRVTLFSHATCILAIQNIKEGEAVCKNAASMLKPKGTFIIVMNHPSFRIPRQTSWGIDERSKLQYRRVNMYMSPIEIPVTMNPGKGSKSPLTWSYHYPLSSYMLWLKQSGFVVSDIQEWTSDKESEGSNKQMENRSRNEIPLFMTIIAEKRS